MVQQMYDRLLLPLLRLLRRKASILMIAFMLGVSNVILEEDRMVHDTRAKIELQEQQPDDSPLDPELPKVMV